MADKKPSVGGTETGHSPSKFKLPSFEQTNPEGKNAASAGNTPMDKIPTTNVTPYGK